MSAVVADAVEHLVRGIVSNPDDVRVALVTGRRGRLGEVQDMADAVVFLASDASRFVNGAGLPVDGGMGM